MLIKYSKHLEERLVLRGIGYKLPKIIYERAKERYLDLSTGHRVAISTAKLYGKRKEVMVAYIEREQEVILLTIHPLKKGQKQNRIKSGRWRSLP